MIETYILFLITLLVGYVFGRSSTDSKYVDNLGKTIIKTVTKPFHDNRVGLVKRPTSEQIYERTHPEIKAGNDAMRESLRDLPI